MAHRIDHAAAGYASSLLPTTILPPKINHGLGLGRAFPNALLNNSDITSFASSYSTSPSHTSPLLFTSYRINSLHTQLRHIFSLSAMFYSAALIAAAGFAGFAAAQNSTGSTGYSSNNTQDYPYYITPAQVALQSTMNRNNWCLAQTNTCNQVCVGAAVPNTCDPVCFFLSLVAAVQRVSKSNVPSIDHPGLAMYLHQHRYPQHHCI